jgi:hypothetical protein
MRRNLKILKKDKPQEALNGVFDLRLFYASDFGKKLFLEPSALCQGLSEDKEEL